MLILTVKQYTKLITNTLVYTLSVIAIDCFKVFT